jgi:hypothetical protein
MSVTARPTSPESSAELRLPGNAGWHARIHVALRSAIRASCSFGLRHGESGVCAVVCLLIAFGLQCRNGAFDVGFGSQPDEAGHYVTGLMVYKYVMTAFGTRPTAFAERFYAHYPVVAFGHWPPLFYILQAIWGLLFGLTRTSALILIAVLTSLVSVLLYHAVRTSLGRPYAVLCAALFPLLPIVQLHTSSVMAEAPLTLFAFATALAFARLIATPTTATALCFWLCLCSAIYVKGNGWALMALPFVALVLMRPLPSLLKKHVCVPMLGVVLCCCPMTLATMTMTMDGWERQSFSLPFFYHAVPALMKFNLTIIGLPLLALACAGAFVTVVRPFAAGRAVRGLWASNFALVVSVLFFHALVPATMEPRMLFMSIPSLLMFAAVGLQHTVDSVRRSLPAARFIRITPLAFGAVIACWYVTHPYSVQHPNMGGVAQRILDDRNLDRTAILVASTEVNEVAELSFVAEVADREHGSYRHAVIRAGKFLADSSWGGSDYKLRYQDAAQVSAAIRAIPISAIALYTGEGRSNAHAALVQQFIFENEDWVCVQSEGAAKGQVALWVSRNRPTRPVRLPEINLMRKLGRNISAEF